MIMGSNQTLKTDTRNYAEVYGETVATFLISSTSFEHCVLVLVPNIDEDLIIRTDIIMQLEILLGLNRRVIGGEEDHPAVRE